MLSASQQEAQQHANVQLDSKVILLSPVRKENVSMTMSAHITWLVLTSTAETPALELVDKIHFVKFEIIVPFALVNKDLEGILSLLVTRLL